MNVIVFGASGMVGGGVLIECLEDPHVKSVLSVGRRPCGVEHRKLEELIRPDLFDLKADRKILAGYDACFFCLGVSAAAGMKEAEYRKVTYDLTLRTAKTLLQANPGLTFCYVSGQGSDRTGRSRFMWARVKGETENELLRMPFTSYMFRPGFIQPLKGVRSRTKLYQGFYSVMGPLYPLLKRFFPGSMTTTENLGRAMIGVTRRGVNKRVLETSDINALAAAG